MKFTLSSLILLSAVAVSAQPLASETAGGPEQTPGAQPTSLEAMRDRLAINQRSRDPFGLSQDLLKPPPPGPGGNSGGRDGFPQKSFSDLLSPIKPTAINPGELFLIDAREFRLGETFTLVRDKRRYTLHVERITADEIEFSNVRTGERATIKVALRGKIEFQDEALPPGIEPEGSPLVIGEPPRGTN